jgi:hypothetical protein
MVGLRTKPYKVAPTGWAARWLEQAPLNIPCPLVATSSTTPTVTLQLSAAAASGDDEIE